MNMLFQKVYVEGGLDNLRKVYSMLRIQKVKVNRKSTELLKSSVTVTDEHFKWQLTRLKRTVPGNRQECCNRHNKLFLQHDNAMLDTACVVKTYLKVPLCVVLSCLQYSTYISLLNYHLFQSIQPNLQVPSSLPIGF